MKKISLINCFSLLNKGDAAIFESTTKILDKIIPNTEFYLFSFNPEIDAKRCNIKTFKNIGKFSISSITVSLKFFIYLGSCFIYRLLGWNIIPLNSGLQKYIESDIIVSQGSDILTTIYGTKPFIISLNSILFALILNKPVMIYANSIGPFEGRLNLLYAKFILNRVNLITVREKISEMYLHSIGINRAKIFLTADAAFLLDPAQPQTINQIFLKEGIFLDNKPLIGISISQLISRYSRSENFAESYNTYIHLMADLVNYLTDKLEATVIFIPHVLGPDQEIDDRIIGNKIYEIVKKKNKVVPINNEYTPAELKGIIGKCDLFIGSRMHATVASTSMHVPTVAIAYSHKTYGIIGEMLGQEKYICDIKNLDFDILKSKVNDVWQNRTEIKRDLVSKVETVKERARLNGKLAKELMDSTINP